jgi:hypothetical protein
VGHRRREGSALIVRAAGEFTYRESDGMRPGDTDGE